MSTQKPEKESVIDEDAHAAKRQNTGDEDDEWAWWRHEDEEESSEEEEEAKDERLNKLYMRDHGIWPTDDLHEYTIEKQTSHTTTAIATKTWKVFARSRKEAHKICTRVDPEDHFKLVEETEEGNEQIVTHGDSHPDESKIGPDDFVKGEEVHWHTLNADNMALLREEGLPLNKPVDEERNKEEDWWSDDDVAKLYYVCLVTGTTSKYKKKVRASCEAAKNFQLFDDYGVAANSKKEARNIALYRSKKHGALSDKERGKRILVNIININNQGSGVEYVDKHLLDHHVNHDDACYMDDEDVVVALVEDLRFDTYKLLCQMKVCDKENTLRGNRKVVDALFQQFAAHNEDSSPLLDEEITQREGHNIVSHFLGEADGPLLSDDDYLKTLYDVLESADDKKALFVFLEPKLGSEERVAKHRAWRDQPPPE